MNYETYYEIADIVIKIDSPFPFFAHNGEDFRCEQKKADFVFHFQQTDNIPQFLDGKTKIGQSLWSDEYVDDNGQYCRAFLWEDQYYTEVSVVGEKEGTCYFSSSDILAQRAEEGFELLMYMCPEIVLLQFDTIVLHSSHLKIGERGLVFSGVSGAGKSTQAELWEKMCGAQVLNGDRSALRKIDGVWQVCGCPMCGSSNIHRKGRESLYAIVMLHQGTDNALKQLKGAQAFREVMPQITTPLYHKEYANRVMNKIEDLISSIPVYQYTCTKDETAVQVLKEALQL
ncbi:hypothetical protein [Eubacterium oxidoreducens]|uniref:HPr Serine kinase C-terminal domain-containing protein n=1 Tax=Eubacterium oxidoreducens TaxID=1732 RepID=A0A1G6AVE2_EUBOX|nr:hypothetical protein [Eubacterium oxidoreducens]SDB12233.1 hypothetical protein SAMN02910417_00921 [Eubacterium oxidoreducens]